MTKPQVLFLCVHNSARSLLAEALLRRLAGDRLKVYSAGSEPTEPQPLALQVLREEGIDVSGLWSKSVGDFVGRHMDYVITLGAEEVCPVFPGAVKRMHWPLPDPAGVEGSAEVRLKAFRETAAELKKRLGEFLINEFGMPNSG